MTELLDGVKILDSTHVLAGPYCSYQLALLGADVIRVEPVEVSDIVRILDRDPTRAAANLGAGFLIQNANKRSIALNLKSEGGAAAFRKLAGQSDVVLENFRPGVMARLGLGPEDLRREHERLIYCSITGFGQTGVLSPNPAYDHIVQALSGIMSVTGEPSSGPVRAGFPLVDYAVGLMAAFAISAALVKRARTGEGEYLDVAMLDTALSMMAPVIAQEVIGGQTQGLQGNSPFSRSPFSGYFTTKAGDLVVVANTLKQIHAMAKILDIEEHIPSSSKPNWHEEQALTQTLKAVLESKFAERTADEWEALLAEADVPAGKVRSVGEAVAHPHMVERQFMNPVEVPALNQTIQVPGPGFLIGGQAVKPKSPPPRHGADTQCVLRDAGYSDQEMNALIAEGAISV